MRPRETSPSEWPARPTRCSPRLTDFGDSTWITRSTAPMSIPSSREEVATRHGSCPDFSISSTTSRSSWRQRPVVGPGDLDGASRPRVLSRRAALRAEFLDGPLLPLGRASPERVPPVLSRRQLQLAFAVGQLVQAFGQALGGAAGVDEDDRRVVFLDQLQQLGVDRGPDRAHVGERLALGRDALGVGEVRGARFGHVLDRDDDLQVELLGDPGVDDLALPLRPDQELRDPLQRALRRREADALDGCRPPREVLEPLQRQRQVGAPLRSGPPRGSRRRSPPRWSRGSRARPRRASGRATRA